MPTHSHLQTLFSQFQSRYPLGCLTSELLAIHQEQYVVRALVQSAGATIATAMAAATELEAAEDRAKIRALEAVGVGSGFGLDTAHSAMNSLNSFLPNPVAESPPAEGGIPAENSQPISKLKLPQPAASSPDPVESPSTASAFPGQSVKTERLDQTVELTEAKAYSTAFAAPGSANLTGSFDSTFEALTFDSEPSTLPPSPLPNSVAATMTDSSMVEAKPSSAVPATGRVKSEKTSKRKAEGSEPTTPSNPTVAPVENPADRSEEIMKIGIEMKRLGWSTEQGREYLKRTYGKRSRQELDDAELLDFLHYLETQPSPLQTPF